MHETTRYAQRLGSRDACAMRVNRATARDVLRPVSGMRVSMMLLAPWVVGCIHEYHPEYHPEVHISYVQNIVTVAAVTPAERAPRSIAPSETFPQTREREPAFVDRRSGVAESPPHVRAPARRAVRTTQHAPVFVADDAPRHGE